MQIALACAVVVVAIVAAVFLFIVSQVSPEELFEAVPDNNNLDVGAEDVFRASIVLGMALIVLAGALSWFVTRRAVRPLGDALRIQRSFVADASHELRTPLAVLDARLQVLQRRLSDDDPSSSTVAELRRDARSLIDIVNDLLESAEVGGPTTARVAVQLNPIVQLAVDSMRVIGDNRAIRIVVEGADPVWTFLAPTSVHRCVTALLDNALRFSPDGSTVVVAVTSTKSTVTIAVRDQGAGIEGIDPARIFDRFAHSGSADAGRGSSVRTGFGIGLALVRDIAVRNGGTVSVKESSTDGTVIALSVPRARNR